MARGISINIGVNNLSDHYDAGEFGKLNSSIKDAMDMADAAKSRGFEEIVLPDATTTEAITKIKLAGKELKAGDICLITFSGHGSQVKDTGVDENDDLRKDETWCFHDRQLLDDDVLDLLTEFKEGVRVLIISDSCHSGTIIDQLNFTLTTIKRFSLVNKSFKFRNLENLILYKNGLKFIQLDEAVLEENFLILEKTESISFNFSEIEGINIFEQKVKTLPDLLVKRVLSENEDVYTEAKMQARESLTKKLRDSNVENFKDLKRASVLLLSACQDWQTTKDGKDENENSVFTSALLKIWGNGVFFGNHAEFHDAISKKVKNEGNNQTPNFYPTGTPNARFILQNPFTIQFP